MIDRQAFGVGLGRVAVALRQALDEPTLTVYYETLRDVISDAADWADFTIDCNRRRRWDWFPQLHDLTDAYRTWQYERKPKLVGLRDPAQFWKSMDQAYLVQAVVEEHPIVEGEGVLAYLERVCLESGLMRPEDAIIHRSEQQFGTAERAEKVEAER